MPTRHPDAVRLLNRFAAPGYGLGLTLSGLFTAIVVILTQSAFWTSESSGWTSALLVGLAVLAFTRPKDALLVLAAVAPLGEVGKQLLHTRVRVAEALVLAALVGALVRGWRTGWFRRFPSGRLDMAALLFGLVVAASCAEQLWFLQMQRHFPWPFVQGVAVHVARDYLVAQSFGMIFSAMVLLEGLALFLWTTHCCRLEPAFGPRLLGMLVLGAAAAAALNVDLVAEHVLKTSQSMAGLFRFVAGARWTVHVGDFNAAGSFFALTLPIAVGGVVFHRKTAFVWLAGAILIGCALWMTGSRTAVYAVLAAATIVGAEVVVNRSTSAGRTPIIVGVLVAAAWILTVKGFAAFRTQGAAAVNIRWMFLGTTLRMLRWQPLFGVGIGQYVLWSKHFSSPQLLAYYPGGENAHNNFSQVAGELGLLGIATFVWLLTQTLWPWKRAGMRAPFMKAALVGLVAFMATWLGGHPMLTPAVAYPFWIVLAAFAGTSRAGEAHAGLDAANASPSSEALAGMDRPRLQSIAAIGIVAAALGISIPLRVQDKASTLSWNRISYGFEGWEIGPHDEPFRWTGPRARFFVLANVTRIGVPIRSIQATPTEPTEIEMFVNNRFADRFHLFDGGWRTLDVRLADHPVSPYHAIELRVSPTFVPAKGHPENPDTRQLGVQVGEVQTLSTQAVPPHAP